MSDIDLKEFEAEELEQLEENLLEDEEITLTKASLQIPIKNLGLKKAVGVQSNVSVQKCIDTMLARHFGALLVVEKEKCVGIFTEGDVLRKIAGEVINFDTTPVSDYMTTNAVTLRMEDTIESALKTMVKGNYHHLCIVDTNDKPLAVVSIRDIIRFIIDFFPQSILNLPPHPIRVGTKHADGG